MPCVPYAGSGVGFFAVPPVGANVWVEFEGGDPDYPIWSGCFWGRRGARAARPAADKMLKTDGITLTLNDLPGAGGFTIEVGPPVVPRAAEDRLRRRRHRAHQRRAPASSSTRLRSRSTTARWR